MPINLLSKLTVLARVPPIILLFSTLQDPIFQEFGAENLLPS